MSRIEALLCVSFYAVGVALGWPIAGAWALLLPFAATFSLLAALIAISCLWDWLDGGGAA